MENGTSVGGCGDDLLLLLKEVSPHSITDETTVHKGRCQNLALMANCGDCCVLLLFCGRESLACRVPYCQAGYFREWLQLLI